MKLSPPQLPIHVCNFNCDFKEEIKMHSFFHYSMEAKATLSSSFLQPFVTVRLFSGFDINKRSVCVWKFTCDQCLEVELSHRLFIIFYRYFQIFLLYHLINIFLQFVLRLTSCTLIFILSSDIMKPLFHVFCVNVFF